MVLGFFFKKKIINLELFVLGLKFLKNIKNFLKVLILAFYLPLHTCIPRMSYLNYQLTVS
jgi:hypothetical protein